MKWGASAKDSRVTAGREKLMIQLKTPEPATVSIKDNDFLLVATETYCCYKGGCQESLFSSSSSITFIFYSLFTLLRDPPKNNSSGGNRKTNKHSISMF